MFLEKIIKEIPVFFDITNYEHLELLKKQTDIFLSHYKNEKDIEYLEEKLFNSADKIPIFIFLILKIAKSKLIVSKITEEIKISVVFAIYKENLRIKTKEENPLGEDFLMQKISQLNYLFKDFPNIKWELIGVDDGCPLNSGKLANEILKKNKVKENVKVLFLKDALQKKLDILKSISSVSESQKGGSIIYGMWYASKKSTDNNHIIIYTDADLSTHLGQIGLLLKPILEKNKNIAIASRREKNSIVIKKGIRNNRGKLFIYLWKRLIKNLDYIIDTQCGFKAFKKEIVLKIVDDLIEKKFAFDIELLLKAELENKNSIEKVAIAWIDSEGASTTTDIQPYLNMLKSIAKMYKKYLNENNISDEFADFIENLNEENFNKIMENVPEEISKKDPIEFSSFDGISVKFLKKLL